jgi:acetoin utilization protein AcuB
MIDAVQRVRSYMSASPWTISPELSVVDAAARMSEHKIRHLPVVDDGTLVGLVSERDIALVDALSERQRHRIPIRQVMRSSTYVCHPDQPLRDVVKVMVEQKLGSVICVEAGKVVGVFTTIDAMRRLIELCQLVELMAP